MQTLLPVFQWFDHSWLAGVIQGSNWLFPAIEAVHIVALCVFVGAVLVLNLRIFGLALASIPVSKLARRLAPWTLCSLIFILASGLMLFTSEAMKCYENSPFQLKMVLLATAILFHFTIYRRMTEGEDARPRPIGTRLAAIASVVLWFGVGFAGRFIAFY